MICNKLISATIDIVYGLEQQELNELNAGKHTYQPLENYPVGICLPFQFRRSSDGAKVGSVYYVKFDSLLADIDSDSALLDGIASRYDVIPPLRQSAAVCFEELSVHAMSHKPA